jgi:hypothetical protein
VKAITYSAMQVGTFLHTGGGWGGWGAIGKGPQLGFVCVGGGGGHYVQRHAGVWGGGGEGGHRRGARRVGEVLVPCRCMVVVGGGWESRGRGG